TSEAYPYAYERQRRHENRETTKTRRHEKRFVQDSFVSWFRGFVVSWFDAVVNLMLIPSIDLQGGAVVQLVQGERLAIKDDDVFRWVHRFERFPKVQVIDLDAALDCGDNLAIVRQIAGALSCRVGGGIRTVERAQEVLTAGAQQIIAGSALFKDGRPDLVFAETLRNAVGRERVIAAVDSRQGHVVIHG